MEKAGRCWRGNHSFRFMEYSNTTGEGVVVTTVHFCFMEYSSVMGVGGGGGYLVIAHLRVLCIVELVQFDLA